MTHTPEEVARVAKGLTKAQRELLIEEDSSVRSYKPAQKLVEMGLWTDDGDDYVIRANRTWIGQVVRAHLLTQGSNSHDG